MSVDEIEAAIVRLSPRNVAKLAAWFAEYHNREWEKQIEDDLDSGRLGSFVAGVKAEYEAGREKLSNNSSA